jgi:S-DNA-T family DNA segregation ATPase FtsK/SpoIIIE
LLVIGLFGLLGIFGLTGLGKNLFYFSTLLLGKFAWLIPPLCLALSYLLWNRQRFSKRYRRSKTDTFLASQDYYAHKSSKQASSTAKIKTAENNSPKEHFTSQKPSSLSEDKIVPIQGFREYFNSQKWPEKDDSNPDKMNELGSDFSTYFGEGQYSFKQTARITTLKGLREYIEGVDQDVSREVEEEDSTYPEKSEVAAVQLSMMEDPDAGYEEIPENKIPDDVEEIGTTEALPERTLPESAKQNIPTEKEGWLPIENHTEQSGRQACLSVQAGEEKDPAENFEEQENIIVPVKIKAPTNNKDEISFIFETEPDLEPRAAVTENVENKSEKILTIDEDLTIDEVLTLAEDTEMALRIRRSWQLPNINLLNDLPEPAAVRETDSSAKLEEVLQDFGINARVVRVTRGPVITRYELTPAPGVKISRIVNLADDIALGLAARDIRIEAPIPGKSAVGIEVPNKISRAVSFREVIETPVYNQKKSKLKVALGKDIADQPVIADLSKMPHLLVAGATGSGKSVCITTIINSLLYNATPDEVKFLFIDPKMVELNQYTGIPHLLAPVVTDPKKAAAALKWIVKEMETRYELFAAAGVRDIERYNKLEKSGSSEENPSMLPWIVVIIDELADLMLVAAGQVEEAICRLAQMARAAGIHLVIATQRPSVDVITGIIKANIPSRISFAVSSSIDSRTILDTTGAEKLLGKGDMLYSLQGINKPQRVQGCLLNDEEAQRVIAYWKSQGRPEYLDPQYLFAEPRSEDSGCTDDSLFIDAGTLVLNSGIASVSYLQRRLKLGYARAARLMDMLEENGVVGAYEGGKPRQILLNLEEFQERFGCR